MRGSGNPAWITSPGTKHLVSRSRVPNYRWSGDAGALHDRLESVRRRKGLGLFDRAEIMPDRQVVWVVGGLEYRGAVPIMTWGGLRGGISVALVLSLPDSEHKPLLLTVTYVVVIFSIIAQGLTMKRVVRHFLPAE